MNSYIFFSPASSDKRPFKSLLRTVVIKFSFLCNASLTFPFHPGISFCSTFIPRLQRLAWHIIRCKCKLTTIVAKQQFLISDTIVRRPRPFTAGSAPPRRRLRWLELELIPPGHSDPQRSRDQSSAFQPQPRRLRRLRPGPRWRQYPYTTEERSYVRFTFFLSRLRPHDGGNHRFAADDLQGDCDGVQWE